MGIIDGRPTAATAEILPVTLTVTRLCHVSKTQQTALLGMDLRCNAVTWDARQCNLRCRYICTCAYMQMLDHIISDIITLARSCSFTLLRLVFVE